MTLEQLIIACGEDFWDLTKGLGEDHWIANWKKENAVYGDTPKEAVQKLYDKLYE